MYCVAVQALFGEYRKSIFALVSVLRRLGEDTPDDQLQVVIRLQDIVAWIVQVHDGTIVNRQVAALLNMTGLRVSKVEIATEEVPLRRGHHCKRSRERRSLADKRCVVVV